MSKVEYANSIKQQIKNDNCKAIKFYFNSIKSMDQDIKIIYRYINTLNPVFTISLNGQYIKSIDIITNKLERRLNFYHVINELYELLMVMYWTIKAANNKQ